MEIGGAELLRICGDGPERSELVREGATENGIRSLEYLAEHEAVSAKVNLCDIGYIHLLQKE